VGGWVHVIVVRVASGSEVSLASLRGQLVSKTEELVPSKTNENGTWSLLKLTFAAEEQARADALDMGAGSVNTAAPAPSILRNVRRRRREEATRSTRASMSPSIASYALRLIVNK
jgi:hypothetical protein